MEITLKLLFASKLQQCKTLSLRSNPVPYPDLEIRGGGREGLSFRPLNKGGLISKKTFFGPLALSLV